MVDDDIADELLALGLTEYQSRAYVAAVNLGTADFAAVAEESGVPRQRIYDVVYSLGDLGLVEVQEGGDGKRVAAPPPETVIEELKNQRIDEVTDRYDRLAEALQRQHSRVEGGTGYVSVVNHESSIRRHARNAIEEARWWLFLSLNPAMYEMVEEEVWAAVETGATVRLLIHAEGSGPSVDALDFPERLVVRRRPGADTVIAADRGYGVFRGLAAPPVTRPTLVTKDENIVEMLQRYSQQFWAASASVQADGGFPRRYLSPWQAVVDVSELEAPPEDVRLRIHGHATEDGRRDTWDGRLVDYELHAHGEADFSVVLPDVARFTVATDEGERTVGGWDATLEDIAAHGIEVDLA